MEEKIYKKSAKISVSDLIFMVMEKDDLTGAKYIEETHVAKGVTEINITVNKSEGQLSADDNPMYESNSVIDNLEVTLSLANVPQELKAVLLGSKIDKNGVLVTSADDTAPWVAMGFKTKLSDNSWDYEWFYKGKFSLTEMKRKSREKGNIEYQTENLAGQFGQRDYDGRIMVSVNEKDPKFTKIKPTFFKNVYEAEFDTASV